MDVTSTTGGFLPPRMSLEQRSRLTPLVAGLVIYQEDDVPGLYLYNGTAWVLLNPDNLGNHNAVQRLNLQDQLLVGTDAMNGQPGATGLRINGSGRVGIGTSNPDRLLQLGSPTYRGPSFLKIGAGNGRTQREWEVGVDVNPDDLPDVTGENYDFAIRDATGNATRLLIDYRNGNVGIGHSAPSEKLEVAGNVKVSQTVEAGRFKYASPKNHVLVIPAAAFVSCSPDSSHAKVKPSNRANSSVMVPFGVYLEGKWWPWPRPGYLAAPITLPQSATITGITLIGFAGDNDYVLAAYDTSVMLSAISPSIGKGGFDLNFEVKATIPREHEYEYPLRSVTTPANHVVRNDLYLYQLTASMNPVDIGARIVSVKISYTITDPE